MLTRQWFTLHTSINKHRIQWICTNTEWCLRLWHHELWGEHRGKHVKTYWSTVLITENHWSFFSTWCFVYTVCSVWSATLFTQDTGRKKQKTSKSTSFYFSYTHVNTSWPQTNTHAAKYLQEILLQTPCRDRDVLVLKPRGGSTDSPPFYFNQTNRQINLWSKQAHKHGPEWGERKRSISLSRRVNPFLLKTSETRF